MAALETALDDALSGQGRLVMLAGEPGIGKTRTAQELAAYAKEHGAQVLWGWCYEEGSLSLPYLPFVEALRDYVLSRETDAIRQELGAGASDVARIVPDVREKLQVELRQPGDPEEDRYRLLQAVSEFLRNAASAQPLLLVLEDLHDADRGNLDLLMHLASNLAGFRLMVLGTYRDVEVDRTHPLSGALANLSRISSFSRVLIRGLAVDEVQRMVEAAAGQEVQSGLTVAVERQTEGNPLFVQEVLRYLAEEGLLVRQEGSRAGLGDASVEGVAGRIPEGLRDVIGKRLSRLSQECNRLLAVASVIGREFPLALLQSVAQVSDEELDASLEEAQSAVVIEERSSIVGIVNYSFAHAFFRQTMYEEIIAPRRLRLHQQVARTIEQQYQARLEEHAVELAEHFSHSSDPSDLAKAVEYGEMAARRATAVYAYWEGVAHAGKDLELARRLDDPEAFWQAAHAWLFLAKAPQHGEEVLRLADELAIRPRTGVSAPRLTSTMCEIGSTFLAWGQRGRAEEVWREMDEVAQRTGNPTALLFSMLANAIFASLDGRLEDAVAMGQSMSNRGGELGISGSAERFSSFASVRPLLYLGKGDDALLQVSVFHRALCLAHLGRQEEVMPLLEELLLARPDIGSDEDETRTERDISMLEAAVLVGHREVAGLLLRRFADTGLRLTGYIHNT